MKTKIKLLRHLQYGSERLYPDCPLSEAMCQMMDKKTLSSDQVNILISVGKCDTKIDTVKERPIKKGASK